MMDVFDLLSIFHCQVAVPEQLKVTQRDYSISDDMGYWYEACVGQRSYLNLALLDQPTLSQLLPVSYWPESYKVWLDDVHVRADAVSETDVDEKTAADSFGSSFDKADCAIVIEKELVCDEAHSKNGASGHQVEIQLTILHAGIYRLRISVRDVEAHIPLPVLIRPHQLGFAGPHYFIDVEKEEWKQETLFDLLDEINAQHRAIIFINSRSKAELLAEALNKRDVLASCMHGGMSLTECEVIMKGFRSGSSRCLIATDYLCCTDLRYEVQQVGLVINYDLPARKESYIQRVGQAGAFGRRIVDISFVTNEAELQDIRQFYDIQIEGLMSIHLAFI
jgi:hypothetical protein